MPRRGAPLIAKFVGGVFKGRLGIAETIAAVGTRELAVDEDGHAGFARAGARIVGRENARRSGSNNESFGFRKKTKRDANRFVLRGEE